MSDSLRPHGLYPFGSSVLGIYQATHQSGLPFPPPGDPHNPGIKPTFPALVGGFFTAEPSGKPNINGKKALKLEINPRCPSKKLKRKKRIFKNVLLSILSIMYWLNSDLQGSDFICVVF